MYRVSLPYTSLATACVALQQKKPVTLTGAVANTKETVKVGGWVGGWVGGRAGGEAEHKGGTIPPRQILSPSCSWLRV